MGDYTGDTRNFISLFRFKCYSIWMDSCLDEAFFVPDYHDGEEENDPPIVGGTSKIPHRQAVPRMSG